MRMERNNIQATRSRERIPYPLFCHQVENGRTEIPKICTRNYECTHCAFDQWLDDMEGRQIDRVSKELAIAE